MTRIVWRATGADAQRIAIVGKSGSGKTTLAAPLARQATRCAWLDIKGLNEPGFDTVRSCTSILEAGETSEARASALARDLDEHGRVAYQLAARPDLKDEEQADAVAQAAYTLGNVLLALDDAQGVLSAAPPYWINRAASMGRARGVGFMAVMTRPAHIPAVLRTEAEHLVLFRLQGDRDLDRLVAEAGPEAAGAAHLQRFHYLWFDRDSETVQAFKPLRASA